MSYYGSGGDGGSSDRRRFESQRDRSRSRDRDSAPQQQRPGGGRGGRGDGGWAGGGGRGRGGDRRQPRPTQLSVKTNYYPLIVTNKAGIEQGEWIQYSVEIRDAFRRKKEDSEEYECFLVPKGKEGAVKEVDLGNGSTPLSRRILVKLLTNEREKDPAFFFATDGTQTAYAPHRLFTDSPSSEPKKATPRAASIYGPADVPKSDSPSEETPLSAEARYKYFEVRVKKDCDEDDPYADRVKSAWFIVRFLEVSTIPGHIVRKFLEGQLREFDEAEKLRQCMDIILKSALLNSGLHSFGRSPRAFYFSEKEQEGLLGLRLKNMFTESGKRFAPYAGILQAAKVCEEGNIFVSTDSVIDFFNREFFYNRGNHPSEPIPLLNTGNSIDILGIAIASLSRPVEQRLRADIESALKKITFHVKYERKPNPDWMKRMREKGINDEKIRRMSVCVRRNKSMRVDFKQGNVGILWAADDPAIYSFPVDSAPRRDGSGEGEASTKEEEAPPPIIHTVASYFREKYKIQLRYPKMPIIYLGKDGWYPIEFLFQSFDKCKGANSTEHVRGVLDHYDRQAGTACVDAITHYSDLCARLEKNGLTCADVLRMFDFKKSDTPLILTAQILPEPALKFAGNQNAELKDGSWNLQNKTFLRPSDMSSFAFVDLSRNPREAHAFAENLFSALNRHKIIMPYNVNCNQALDDVLLASDDVSPAGIHTAIKASIEKAKAYFLYDQSGVFRSNKVWFKSRAKSPNGGLTECLIIPPPDPVIQKVGLILPSDELFSTHDLSLAGAARIMVMVQGNQIPIDPFNFFYDPIRNTHFTVLNGECSTVQFSRFVYVVTESQAIVEEKQAGEIQPYSVVDEEVVECPSIVFIYLQNTSSEPYFLSKMVSNFYFGVQSQCATSETYKRQKNPTQYCSNIALKLNTKLMSVANGARAWDTAYTSTDTAEIVEGIPWVPEVPTLVLGFGLSHGFGKDSISVIGASACLDPGCMQMAQQLKCQSKADIIEKSLIVDMVKALAVHFFQHNRIEPVRILVYRDGVSDGNIERLKTNEIAGIRQAFYDLNCLKAEFQCNNDRCKGRGCIFCTPPITFVVCLTQHNIRIVPTNESDYKNVPSGTCVDKTIVLFKNSCQIATRDIPRESVASAPNLQLFSGHNEGGCDFLLTAQGGLKGTSKPIYYSVVLNENAVFCPKDCGGTPLLQNKLELCTYHMSYQYGTATKAVRKVPVVFYAQRLAKQAIGYINYLRGRKGGLREEDSDVVAVDLDPLDEAEAQQLPKRRDGTPYERQTFLRRDMMNDDNPPELMTELLPAFSPFAPSDNGVKFVSPFRPHLSS